MSTHRDWSLPWVRARLARVEPASDSGEAGARAAVAAVLRERAGLAELLLIRRTENPKDPWSGHMALPGGRRDPDDRDLLHTARREAREEVGLDPLHGGGALLTRLPDVPAIARGRRLGLVIAPFVFAVDDAPDAERLAPDPSEVAEALWHPLEPLARGEGAGTFPYVYEGQRLELPCVRLGEGRVLWGLTHQMVQTLVGLLRDEPR